MGADTELGAGTERNDPTPERSRRSRVTLGVAIVLMVGLGGFAAWALWPRGTSEITAEEALAEYRRANPNADPGGDGSRDRTQAATTDPGTDSGTDSDPARRTPEPGVYEYRASGSERVKLGPLPAQDRELPSTVTISVGASSEAPEDTTCFEWTLNLFREHTETTTWCTDDDGTLTLDAHTKHQSFGALSPTATVVCDPNTLADPAQPTIRPECSLTLEGGPASIEADLSGTATTRPVEDLVIGADVVAARPLVVTYEVTGALTGSWDETIWLSEELLPLRIERDLDLSGPATLSESSTLELTGLRPTR